MSIVFQSPFLKHHSPELCPRSRPHSLNTTRTLKDTMMRFTTLLFAAVAGLWQQPLVSEEETITSTRHIHVTRFVTDLSSTAYAVHMGTLTLYMEYLPATLTTKPAPWQALQTPHLELRAEEVSTMHIKVTQTVAETEATIFASKVGTSILTITNVPQSLIEEAAEDAAKLRSSQLAAVVPLAKADALTHSTAALLAGTALSSATSFSALPSPTLPGPVEFTDSSASSTSPQLTATSPSSPIPIGLELRSNAEKSTGSQLQATTTQVPSTVVVVIYGSSTSTMTSTHSNLPATTTSSQASTTSVLSISRQTVVSEHSTQSVPTPASVNTNAAQIKSIQTALIQAPTYSDTVVTTSSSASSSPSASSPSPQACGGTCSSLTHISTVVSSSSPSSASSNQVYTIPVTMFDASSSATSTVEPSAVQTSDSATMVTSYGAQSSSSTAADIAADNAAGASGGDSSFKLSKGGFAAIISVVSIGVGLGST
jgi:hypothetical protein